MIAKGGGRTGEWEEWVGYNLLYKTHTKPWCDQKPHFSFVHIQEFFLTTLLVVAVLVVFVAKRFIASGLAVYNFLLF